VADVYDAMRWLSPIFILLHVAALSGCSPAGSTTVVAGEDVRVLRAIVKSACALQSKQIVSDLPITPFNEVLGDNGAPIARFGLNLDVRSPGEVRWPQGDICATVRVVDDAVVKEVLSHETSIPPRWTFFRKQFDDAKRLMRISLPAYSADGRTAVVYAEGTCPYTCGAGFFYELRKSGNEWTIARSENDSNLQRTSIKQ
jgi:hypothetical protein